MLTKTPKNRYQAFCMHLAISALIAALIIYICFYYWYQQPLFKAGGSEGIFILLSIDLVLGPLLTLIIFNPAKKSLKWDLTAIGLIQALSLSAGLYFVYNEKPDLVVLSAKGVNIISRADRIHFIDNNTYKKLKTKSNTEKTPFFIAKIPFDDPANALKSAAVFEVINQRPFELAHENYYLKQELSKPLISKQTKFINEHFINKTDQQKLKNLMVLSSEEPLNCKWTVVRSNHFDGFGCVNYLHGIVKLIKK